MRELRYEFNAGDPEAVLCSTVFKQGPERIPSYASYKAAQKSLSDDTLSLPLDQLVPTQDELMSAKLGTDPEFWEGSTITVISLDGKLLIWDGHHRAASALLAGQAFITADIYEI